VFVPPWARGRLKNCSGFRERPGRKRRQITAHVAAVHALEASRPSTAPLTGAVQKEPPRAPPGAAPAPLSKKPKAMAAAVDAGEGAAGALEQFCTLAKSAGGSRAVGDIVQQALNAKRVFVFGELLAEPNVRALKSTDQANQLRLLEIFAYGTYSDYKKEASSLPPLTPPQKTKLRQLSLVSLARKASVVPYDAIGEALEVTEQRDLEDLVIETVYAGLVAGKMDQMAREFKVQRASGRDVKPDDVAAMADALTDWADRADAVAEQLEENKVQAKALRDARKGDAAALQAKIEDIKNSLQQDDAAMDIDRPKRRAKRSRAPFKGGI
jgi:COP9 signalosome complex subunit 7